MFVCFFFPKSISRILTDEMQRADLKLIPVSPPKES